MADNVVRGQVRLLFPYTSTVLYPASPPSGAPPPSPVTTLPSQGPTLGGRKRVDRPVHNWGTGVFSTAVRGRHRWLCDEFKEGNFVGWIYEGVPDR